jgi:AcrR family transcriptional regulator
MKFASPSVIQTNSAGAVTRRRIIDVAERLFADRGIDGVPLKQIATAAGQANVNAIQYHFGSKSGLVFEILRTRFDELNRRRLEGYRKLADAGRLDDVRALLSAMYRPRAEMTDEAGNCTYSKFIMEFRVRFRNYEDVTHPEAETAYSGTPTSLLRDSIAACASHLPTELAIFRMGAISNMIDAALVERDTTAAKGEPVPDRAIVVERVLDMAVAAVMAPRGSG